MSRAAPSAVMQAPQLHISVNLNIGLRIWPCMLSNGWT